jgi:GntR family transcriptional repressor for pyruvate dehydrogenase complex
MIDSLRPISRLSLSDVIVGQIIDLISRGVLKPGERMPSEKLLCQQFAVGRTSVREALRSLSVMGILESHAGDGTFVADDNNRYLEKALQWSLLLDRKVVDDLIETRLTLESETSCLAAQRARPDELHEISVAIEGMEESANQSDVYLDFDLRFHLAIARASQNSILFQLLSMIRGYLQTWIKETLNAPPRRDSKLRAEKSVAEHRKVLSALEAGNAQDARQAMREHILSSSVDLREWLAMQGMGISAT